MRKTTLSPAMEPHFRLLNLKANAFVETQCGSVGGLRRHSDMRDASLLKPVQGLRNQASGDTFPSIAGIDSKQRNRAFRSICKYGVVARWLAELIRNEDDAVLRVQAFRNPQPIQIVTGRARESAIHVKAGVVMAFCRDALKFWKVARPRHANAVMGRWFHRSECHV